MIRISHDNRDLTLHDLVEKMGIIVGGLNCCPKALMKNGLGKMRNFANY
jgi:hypothetical protein